MEENKNIKQKLSNWLLARKASKIVRNKATMNLENAKSALFLLDGLDVSSVKTIEDFNSFLKQNKINVDSIRYFDNKEIKESKAEGQLNFSKKNLNLFGLPKSKEFAQVYSKKYDLLFDFSIKQHFALRCIADLVPARFKIGMLPGNNAFDFMIDLGKTRKIPEFIIQLKKYLPLLKSK